MAGDRQGIVIRFLSEFVDFVTGKNRVKDELKDLDRGLDEMGDTSEQATSKATDGLSEVEDAARTATDATDDLGDSADQAKEKSGSFTDNFKGGLLAIAGVAGGVAGLVQTVLGKAVDFVTQQIMNQIKAADEMKRAITTAYQDAGAAGDKYLSKAQITANALAIINDDIKRSNAERDAAAIGVDASTYIRAQAGEYEALKVVIEATKRAQDKLNERPPSPADYEARAAQERLNNIEAQNKALQNLHDQGQANAEFTIQVTNDIKAAELDRIEKTKTADQERYEALAQHVQDLDGKTITIDAEFDSAEADKQLAAWRKRFTTGNGSRITIVADIVDRYGRRLDQ